MSVGQDLEPQFEIDDRKFFTAAECLGAYKPGDMVWMSGHRIGPDELRYMAEQEAKAPDPEDVP